MRVQQNPRGMSGPLAPQEIGGFGNKLDDPVRFDGNEFGEEIVFVPEVLHWRYPPEAVVVARATEAGRQPGSHKVLVGEIGSGGIDNGGPRIDAGLDRVWLYELLAKAVNRCAGNLVEGSSCVCNGDALVRGKTRWQRVFQFWRSAAIAERGDEALNAFEQFRGRGLGEGYGDDVARVNAVR